jgi:hypothetical protein
MDHAVIQESAELIAEHAGRGVTRVGALLKIPVGVNCTCPLVKSWASAIAGLAMTDWSIRGLLLPHPVLATKTDKARVVAPSFIEASKVSGRIIRNGTLPDVTTT